jgi:glutathione S-transferase
MRARRIVCVASISRKRNSGRVPALVTPRGVLTETPAILAYVAQVYPTAQLAPLDDPFAFGQLQAFNSYICSTLHVAHAHRMRGTRWADEPEAIAAMQRKVPDSVGACYAYIEEQAGLRRSLRKGRDLYDRRSLSIHRGAMDGGRWRRSSTISEGRGAP